MMNKILKNGKSALSFVVALAVIAVSVFVALPLANVTADAAIPTTDTWDGTKVEPTVTDADGNIIISSAEELAWVALTPSNTSGKKYKVADGQVFNLNAMSGITLDSTAAEVKAATRTDANLWQQAADNNNTPFEGNFDGNGLIVYNMATTDGKGHGNAGLFPHVKTPAGSTLTIKNVKIVASVIVGYHNIGGVVGLLNAPGGGVSALIDSCAVENCVINDNANPGAGTNKIVAGIVGHVSHNTTTVNNCLVKDNDISGLGIEAGFIGNTSDYSGAPAITNSIAIGISPIPEVKATTPGTKLAGLTYSAVYTDEVIATPPAGVIPNDLAEMTGEKCSKLDFSGKWLANTDLPELRVFHKLSATDMGDGTHAESCTRCGLSGFAADHSFSIFIDERTDGCACGATQDAPKRATDVWDGTFEEPTKRKSGKIIIENAEQLAWVALKGGAETNGKSYKVEDNQVFDLNGFEGINLNSKLEDVKNAAATGNLWRGTDDAAAGFGGNFDGNGLIVYNINSYKGGSSENGHGGAGLFPYAMPYEAAATQTFTNVKVALSAFKAYHGAGGIVGYSSPNSTDRHMIFENIAVESIYVHTQVHQQKAGGLIGAAGHNGLSISNCSVVNVELVGKFTGGLVASTSAYSPEHTISSSITIGVSPLTTETATKLDSATYTNVYTDVTVARAGVTTVTDWAGKPLKDGFDPAVWFANTTREPVLRSFHTITYSPNNADNHSSKCEYCGLTGLDSEAHDWINNDGKCADCNYGCKHENAQDGAVVVVGDCVTPKEIAQICECGAAPNRLVAPQGHELTKASDGFAPDQCIDGQKPYWTCSICHGRTISDDKMAPVASDDDIRIPATVDHIRREDSLGIVYDTNLKGYHRYLCDYCNQPYGAQAHTGNFDEDFLDPSSGHTGECTVCKAKVEEKEPHIFGDDSICDTCNWECVNHVDDEGVIVDEYSCITSETRDFTCQICGREENRVTITANGHDFQLMAEVPAKCNANGTKAHNHCTECGKDFATDADPLTVLDSEALTAADLEITDLPDCTTVIVPEVPAKCETTGVAEHKKCETCGKLYDLDGNEVFEEELVTDALPHLYKDIVDGKPKWEIDETYHWHICSREGCPKGGITDKAEHYAVDDTTSYEGVFTHCGANCGGGVETFVHKNESKDKIVSITSSENAYDRNVWTAFTDICDEDEIYATLEESLAGVKFNEILAYDITPDMAINADGTVTITFAVPDDYEESLEIRYIDTVTKTSTVLESEIVADKKGKNRKMSVTVNSLTPAIKPDYSNVYVLLELDKSAPPPSYDENTDPTYPGSESPATADQNTAVAVATVAALISVAFVTVKKAKKS